MTTPTGWLTHKDGDDDHHICLVVEDVEEYNKRLEHVEEDRANRQTFQTLTTSPKLNI